MSKLIDWTDEIIEDMRLLKKKGLSNGLIAAELRHKYKLPFTRNGVIGKCSRLYIPTMTSNGGGRPPIKTVPRAKKPISLPAIPQPKIEPVNFKERPAKKWVCQYMTGGEICGVECIGSWCDEHKRIVYAPRESTVSGNHKADQVARRFRL